MSSDIVVYQALFHAARVGDLAAIKALGNAVDINLVNHDRCTSLMVSSHCGNFEVVKYLINIGAELDMKDKFNWTALLHAARNGHFGIVRRLVSLGSDCTIKDSNNCTALMLAADNGHVDIVRFLATVGCDITTRSKYGDTAMLLAAQRGHLQVVKFLASIGSPINAVGRKGRAALLQAAAGQHYDMVQFLVAQGAALDIADDDGNTVCNYEEKGRLAKAIQRGFVERIMQVQKAMDAQLLRQQHQQQQLQPYPDSHHYATQLQSISSQPSYDRPPGSSVSSSVSSSPALGLPIRRIDRE